MVFLQKQYVELAREGISRSPEDLISMKCRIKCIKEGKELEGVQIGQIDKTRGAAWCRCKEKNSVKDN